MMNVKVDRDSVCMGDDCTTHCITMQLPADFRLSDLLRKMVSYVPAMKNVVWAVSSYNALYGYLITDADTNTEIEVFGHDLTIRELSITEVYCRYFSSGNLPEAKAAMEGMQLYLLTDDYLPYAEKWLNKEHIKRWYEIPEMGVTIDDWLYEIHEYRGSFHWITYLVMMWQHHPIGMCQYYKAEDSKEEDFHTLPLEGTYGIDYYIGEEELLHKGLGTQAITMLAKRILSMPGAKRVTADIDPKNKASAGVLLASGFHLLEASDRRYVFKSAETVNL